MTRFHLDDYLFGERIYHGNRSMVFRGKRKRDDRAVVIKIHGETFPDAEILLRFRREYEIGSSLSHPNIVKYIGLEKLGHGFAIIEEDFGGISLAEYMIETSLDLDAFFGIALQAVKGLVAVHQNRVMHRDITPRNLVLDPSSGLTKLIDFGLASELSLENGSMASPNRLEGTLRYLSPEQTGRMNRGIDYRTDFYSLGVTFYHLLCGVPPFVQEDPLELIHAHIARPPVPPRERNPLIPEVLSELIMRLMAKNAEDRYQSSAGLLYDLQQCAGLLAEKGAVEWFQLGSMDANSRFMIPQALYGRELEVERLMASWDRVMRQGSEIVLVTGYSGIGKTSLVKELYRPVVAGQGYFAGGKFDQYQRQVPYAAPVDAFRKLLHLMLTETEERLEQWRQRLTEALKGEERILADLLPELEQVTGRKSSDHEERVSADRQRVCLALCKMVRAIAHDRPLVLFLDDLQWLDGGTLELLKILCLQEAGQLMLIGAYRDNEVTPGHPLILALEFLKQEGISINHVKLGPLSGSHLQCLVADTLNAEPTEVTALAELVEDRTGGNPFFVAEFLKRLHVKELLRFRNDTMRWTWDLSHIHNMDMTDNVVELVVDKLEDLPETSRHLLRLASCIGHDVDLETLCTVAERTPEQTVAALWPAVGMGLIRVDEEAAPWFRHRSRLESLPDYLLSSTISFLHDRVQQAAYQLIEKRDRPGVHLKIGNLLLARFDQHELEERIYEVAPQLQQGMSMITSQEERTRMASLFLKAGRKSLYSAAFDMAYGFMETALDALDENSWDDHYQLTLDINQTMAKAQYGLAERDACNNRLEMLLNRVRESRERVDLILGWLDCQYWHSSWADISERALDGLINCGCSFPLTEDLWVGELAAEKQKTQQLLAGRKMEDVFTSSQKAGKPSFEVDRALEILVRIMTKGYGMGLHLLHQLSFHKGLNLIMEKGTDKLQMPFILQCAMARGMSRDFVTVNRLCDFLAREIPKKVGFSRPYWFMNDVAASLMSTSRHLSDVRDTLLQCARDAAGVGDHHGVVVTRCNAMMYIYQLGDPLNRVLDFARDLETVSIKKQFPASLELCKSYEQLVLTLQGFHHPDFFTIASYGEVAWQRMLSSNVCLQVFSCRLQACFWLGRYEEALEFARSDDEKIFLLSGYIHVHEHHFFAGLCAARCLETCPVDERDELLSYLSSKIRLTSQAAEACPDNFEPQYLLLLAELEILEGRELNRVCAHLEKAIQAAGRNSFIQYEALVNERLAELWLSLDMDQVAAPYLQEACYLYGRWGASMRVDFLKKRHERKYRSRINPFHTQRTVTVSTTIHHSSSGGPCVDLETVLRAARAILGEIDSSRLLPKMMRTILEGMGARRSFLILEEDGRLLVRARADISNHQVRVSDSQPIEDCDDFSEAIVRFVVRSGESRVLPDFQTEDLFAKDPWLEARPPRSTLCTPVRYKDHILGALYLENELSLNAFTPERIKVLDVLLGQAATALENARLFQDLSSLNASLGDTNHALAGEMEERSRDEKAIRRLNRELEERVREKTAQLELTRKGLIEKAHQAGMADIATSVLHNVGNLLNSVSISSQMICETIQSSRLESMERANQMLVNLARVSLNNEDVRSEKLADYYQVLTNMIREDHDSISENVRRIEEKVQEVRDVVASQQKYVNQVETFTEQLELAHLIRETMDIMTGRLARARIKPRLNLEEVRVVGQKVKLIHVFMNIINNAIEALQCRAPNERRLTIESGANNLFSFVRISDNGEGIPSEHMDQIFNHGFTTKPDAHGFGLHSSANAVTGMGGGIRVESGGPGKGADFILELPGSDHKQAL